MCQCIALTDGIPVEPTNLCRTNKAGHAVSLATTTGINKNGVCGQCRNGAEQKPRQRKKFVCPRENNFRLPAGAIPDSSRQSLCIFMCAWYKKRQSIENTGR